MYRIFIVEDDAVIAGEIARHIESWGYEARCARDFRNVLAEFAAFDPHLVLMDIGLPFYNGYHWCRKIREISQVPVVFLSSAADNMNIVLAMDIQQLPAQLAQLGYRQRPAVEPAGVAAIPLNFSLEQELLLLRKSVFR